VNLTDKDVREILRLLDESPYDEMKLQTDNFNLTLKRTATMGWNRDTAAEFSGPETETPDVDDAAAESAPDNVATRVKTNSDIRDIYPPLPGTFYRAPSPAAEPFVDVGSPVKEDTIVGLVETMKLMNSVMAGCCGEVVEICIENGALIEAHDVLLRIREAGS
jgi:acetyl-CoA carboxylase biotin carboxyl carrier protein